jgi:hypothetical protein
MAQPYAPPPAERRSEVLNRLGNGARSGATLAWSLLIGAALAMPAPPRADGAGFGRWESRLRSCSLEAASGPERECVRLRLEQPMAGLLNVRFVGAGSQERPGGEEVLFAGDLSTGQAPLHCDAQGRCQPPPIPLRVRVRMVAWAGFDARGLAAALPQSRLASGECLIERVEVRCDADLTESRALADPTPTTRRWTAHGQRLL